MRLINIERKKVDAFTLIVGKVFNQYIPVLVGFMLGYSRHPAFLILLVLVVMFEVKFDGKGFQLRY